MKEALIGYTGFVGSTLASQHTFTDFFNSKNIEEISGKSFQTIVCSAMPAAKWLANKDPSTDRACLDKLVFNLRQAKAEEFILISTVDVYGVPTECDEDTPIDRHSGQAYGLHRLLLEDMVREIFPKVMVVRLPALFGAGLKKNIVFDLMNNNQVEKINSRSVFQFYNVENLWRDISAFRRDGIDLVNLMTEPTSVAEVAKAAFDLDFENDPGTPAAHYDLRSKYGAPYFYSKESVLKDLRAFVQKTRTI